MLCGVSVVRLTEPAKLLPAGDRSVASRLEGSTRYFIFHIHNPVRPLRIVVADPGIRDVVELVPTKAHEVVETCSSHCADERLGGGYNSICVDARAQHPNLGFEELKPRVVDWGELVCEEGQQRIGQSFQGILQCLKTA